MENEKAKGLQNQEDVAPSEQLEKLVVDEPELEHPPHTNGTGANREVFNNGSLIIKKDEEEGDGDQGSTSKTSTER